MFKKNPTNKRKFYLANPSFLLRERDKGTVTKKKLT